MANNEDNLIREVEEELRRERMEQLWKQYGSLVLGAAVAVVLGVAGFKFYEQSRVTAAQTAGAGFEKASNLATDGKKDDALAAFADLAKSGPGGYAQLARLRLAALHLEAGRKSEAVAAYEAVAGEAAADPLMSSYAKLQLGALKVGDAPFTEVENRLNDLAAAEGPWRANARELIALAALKDGQTDRARAMLEELLADRTTPQNVRERAQVSMGRIIAEELAKAPPATGTGAPGEPSKGQPAPAVEPAITPPAAAKQ
ncbi:MAG: tetratricopeptide repeat protein [Hyphomicrobiaceae bacterium]